MHCDRYRRLYAVCSIMAEQSKQPDERARWFTSGTRLFGTGKQALRRSPSQEMCGGSLEVEIDGSKLAHRRWIARGIKRWRLRLLHDCHNPFALDEYSPGAGQVRARHPPAR
jgi:hypothetical protein